MTAPDRRSRGARHASAIKSSPRWDAWLVRCGQIRRGRYPVEERQPDPTAGWLRLAEAAYGKSGLGLALVRPTHYDAARIRDQLRDHYRQGYVQALRDALRERERQELNRYVDALPTMSRQEAARVCHAYDNDGMAYAR